MRSVWDREPLQATGPKLNPSFATQHPGVWSPPPLSQERPVGEVGGTFGEMEDHTTLSAPINVPPSSLAVSFLAPIPGSSAPTPSLQAAPGRRPPSIDDRLSDTTPLDGDSRRSSVSSHLPIPDSYFPPASSSSFQPLTIIPSTSEASSPSERPRPTPLTIPSGTPDEPLFSAFPNTGQHQANSKGKGRNFTFPLKPAFNLARPPSRSRQRAEDDDSSTDEAQGTGAAGSSDSSSSSTRPKPPRRRASTISHPPSLRANVRHEDRRFVHKVPPLGALVPKSFAFQRRRASAMSPVAAEFNARAMPHWPGMASEEERRIASTTKEMPFVYEQPGASDYTLQSVSTVTTARPLESSPVIADRKSSLMGFDPRGHTGGISFLSMGDRSRQTSLEPQAEVVIPDDMVMPHGPPPRRSSLDYGSRVSFELMPSYDREAPSVVPNGDVRSILSSSLTGTDTSHSATTHSPTPSSQEHPLSSATTSLSRSAKSGKEGSDEKDAALSTVRLQRSLEWELRQTSHRRGLEKRRMILLELAETEISYVEDLKTLVQVYLPQMYALPSVSERTADMVARNSTDLLLHHAQLVTKMVDVLKDEGLRLEPQPELFLSGKLERIARRVAALFVEEVSGFSVYNEYCAGSIAAATLVRHIALRTDYDAYEKRCQLISSTQPYVTLQNLLSEETPSPVTSNSSRLHFRDFLIMPIQRVCRYPLLLSQLLDSAAPSSPTAQRPEYGGGDVDDFDVGVDIERALGAMRGVAEEADEARRVREAEIKSATIIERMDPHPALTPAFLKTLGTCRLIGSLDVLYHHSDVAPLVPPVRVKYFAAFLYRGYLVLAKVRKGKMYEAKHFLPLEVFELIDITEGFLPHSIRLVLRDHHFDLAASCEAEKDVWSAALCEARDESTVPPFELPASVSPFPIRTRRMSTTAPPPDFAPSSPTSKRHTLSGLPTALTDSASFTAGQDEVSSPAGSPDLSFSSGVNNERRSAHLSTILLRRASASQRLTVDRGLIDVFSESCATARSKAQMNHGLFLPEMPSSDVRDRMSTRDSTSLHRRRSFLDTRAPSVDIAFSGEIKGSVIPVRQTRSSVGKRRTQSSQRHHARSTVSRGNESATEVDGRASADETAGSDRATLTGRPAHTRTSSVASLSPMPSPRRSMSNLRSVAEAEAPQLTRRKTASVYNLHARFGLSSRTKSMPVSPVVTPGETLPMAPSMALKSTSDLINPAISTDNVGYFPDAGDPSPVHNQENGLTNQLDRSAGSTSAWTTLRRNLSFVKASRSSAVSLEELVACQSYPDLGEANGSMPKSRSSMTSQVSEDGVLRNLSALTLSDRVNEGNEEVEGGEETLSTNVDVVETPRRKRSTRLFHSLSRFTPI